MGCSVVFSSHSGEFSIFLAFPLYPSFSISASLPVAFNESRGEGELPPLFSSCRRGERRMWMGWVSPRLGERSITCEPKGEEIGAISYLQEWSRMPMYMCKMVYICIPIFMSIHSVKASLYLRTHLCQAICTIQNPCMKGLYALHTFFFPRVFHHNRFTDATKLSLAR